jgi:invasion protein IalB
MPAAAAAGQAVELSKRHSRDACKQQQQQQEQLTLDEVAWSRLCQENNTRSDVVYRICMLSSYP